MAIKVISPNTQSYITVPKTKILVGYKVTFEILLKEGSLYKPFLEAGKIFTTQMRELLDKQNINEVYVPAIYQEALSNYIFDSKKIIEAQAEQKAVKQYSHKKDEHIQIDKSILFANIEVPFNIFTMKFTRTSTDIISLHQASEKSPSKVSESIIKHTGDLLIHRSDMKLYNEYIKSLTTRQDLQASEKQKLKAISIKENSKLLMKELLEDPRSGEAIKNTETMVDEMLGCILESKDAIYNLLSLKNYDYYTYTHCVNVAVMSIGIGNLIGLSKDDIECLGKGAMLHDIGKSVIPSEVLNKQGKLDEIEYKIIQSHVLEGEKVLQEHKINPKCMPAILQHHEKISGKGYPYKLKDNELDLFGKISAIADCYDALTTKRPYKNAFTPFHALSIIAKETGDYDPDLLKVFIKMLGKIE